ncbi:PAS domain S-box protein [Rubinisphaera sp.]|uniref:PAS domain S-box protein n=1 Tax=Rubinisphaera sp. TaxID=2024857 RepID=UPI000C0C6A66|nr:PAS domain S-box protein [Rubinisphaera sp.]MBV10160.1 hypothetical protein [Rubinisphaera sp.]HCS52471.1 hypothetical protein [Planctomycetaceae bacterium]|tara:strand:+ start:1643 stop:5449 length:3807 start_codon:yes stop_codon:yes gene_type:complete
MSDQSEQPSPLHSLPDEVQDRFGVLPNFFRLAPDTPQITENLWGFAKFGYLDNPLPSLFKERLFVYLSQFCEVRYCISRHVGFLVGLGKPSGDKDCPPETIEQIVRLLRRPLPVGETLDPHIQFCENRDTKLIELPESESLAEEAIFSCATHVFLQTAEASRCLNALRQALESVTFQQLLVFLTFVRTAHFWTKVHPELKHEDDITELLTIHKALAGCVLRDPEAKNSESTKVLLNELIELRKERDQAEMLRITLASIGDGVIATDPHGRVTLLNAVAEELTGWTGLEAIGKPIESVFQIVNEQTRQPVVSPALEALREGKIVALANHTILIAKDGTERPIDDSAAPIRDADGNIAGSVLIFRDITQRKRIQKSERMLASVVESSDDAIISKTLDGIIQSWNGAAERIFGYTPEQAIGRHISFLIPEERANEEDQIIQRIRAGERVDHFETVRVRSDGELIHVSLTISPIRDASGRVVGASKIARDFTEQKRAEEALRHSEQRYRTLFESMDEGFCVIEVIFDENEKPVDYLFHETNQIFDVQCGLQNVTGKRVKELIPEHEDNWFEIYGKVATTGESIRFTQESKKLGRWFDLYASRIGDAESRMVAVIFNDITARKQNEAERERLLRAVDAERKRLTDVFQHAPSFMCVLSGPDHVFERANERYFQLVGHRELIGKSIREALPEVEGQGFIELLDRVYKTGEPFIGTNMQVLLQKGAGDDLDERFVDFVYQALRNAEGEVTGIIAQGVDLTARHTAELALRENENRFRMLVEQVQDYAIFMTDTKGRATSWNEGVLRVLGFEEDEFIGNDIKSAIFTPEDQELNVPQLELEMAAKSGSASDDRWMMRKDGTRIWAAGVTTGLHNENGKLLGFMKVMRDQTVRKQMEDDLRQYAADLSEADRRKTEFLATLGHELRNPLAPIRTGLEVMKMAKDDQAAVEEVRCMMERQVQQMVRLIDDLLDVSRITQGKMVLRTCRVDLAEIIQSAIEATRTFIDEAGHDLKVELPPQTIFINADPNRLAQVISNLLNNSSKYTPEGGQIQLTCHRLDSEVVLSVRDNGLGIPPEMLDNIFEMFTQIDRSIEEGYTGLGIGLTLVKRLVEMHGGTIEVHSDGADKGSEFTLRLPIVDESDPEETTEEVSVITSQLRILVVDDNKAAATMLKMVVKLLGNEVRVAHDGKSAIEVASEFLPEVILMDLGMPVMNGYEAARHIREQEWGKEILLVALTGWGQDEDKQRTEQAGFDHHLVKPAEPAALQQLLANHQWKSN